MVGSDTIQVIDGSQVVRTALGPGTGDKRYQTADGRWWQSRDGWSNSEPSTGVTIATLETYRSGSK